MSEFTIRFAYSSTHIAVKPALNKRSVMTGKKTKTTCLINLQKPLFHLAVDEEFRVILEDRLFSEHFPPFWLIMIFKGEWVKCVTRTRVRVTNWENICRSKIYVLKALNCLNKGLYS